MASETKSKLRVSRAHKLFLIAFMLIFFIPAGVGFTEKLYMFVKTVGEEPQGRFAEGRFAIIPLLNYLLVFAGMLCLLVWAIHHGMFRDVEGPKYTMLERERELDEQAGLTWENGDNQR